MNSIRPCSKCNSNENVRFILKTTLWICEECEKLEKYNCQKCLDTGKIEILGDGDNFEVDVIGIKKCICQIK